MNVCINKHQRVKKPLTFKNDQRDDISWIPNFHWTHLHLQKKDIFWRCYCKSLLRRCQHIWDRPCCIGGRCVPGCWHNPAVAHWSCRSAWHLLGCGPDGSVNTSLLWAWSSAGKRSEELQHYLNSPVMEKIISTFILIFIVIFISKNHMKSFELAEKNKIIRTGKL